MPDSLNTLLEVFESPIPIYFALTAHCLIGGFAAFVARRKGYNFSRWIIWGLIGGTAALISALWIKPKSFE